MGMQLKLATLFLLGVGTAWAQTNPPADAGNIGYKSAADAEQKKTLLLRDFHPVSMLHVPTHEVPRAKFYVIDVHNHINDAAGIDEHMPPARVVEVMDRTNVKTVVILTGMWGDKLQHVIDEMVKPYPGRFIVFAQLDYSRINDPNFGEEMVRLVDDSVARGARGLKFLKDLGLGVRDKSGKLIAIDDPRLDPSGASVDAWGFRFLSTPEIPKHSSIPRTRTTSATRSLRNILTGASTVRNSLRLRACWRRATAFLPGIRKPNLFRCTWAGRRIWIGSRACSTSIPTSWWSLGRAKPSWAGSPGAPASSFLNIRTG